MVIDFHAYMQNRIRMTYANPGEITMTNMVRKNPSAGSLLVKELTNLVSDFEKQRIRINKEIGNYPAPIPACDAQFNYLLDERSRVSAELKRIDTLISQSRSGAIGPEIIEELGRLSNRIDKEPADRLKAVISQVMNLYASDEKGHQVETIQPDRNS